MQLGAWNESAKVTYDRQLWSELLTLRFVQAHHNVMILGPVGVGKTHLANVLGHVACRRGMSIVMARSEHLLKELKASRLDHTYDREMRN